MKYEIYIFEEAKTASFYKKAIEEYEKRLSRYCKISYQFIKKEKEWEKKWNAFPEHFVILPGKQSISSEDFSKKIQEWEISGQNKLVFFIPPTAIFPTTSTGSCLFLSCFTMNCAMSALLLYEQIYRGYRILHHHPYHK